MGRINKDESNSLEGFDRKINMRVHPIIFGIILFLGFFVPRTIMSNEPVVNSAMVSIVFSLIILGVFLLVFSYSMKKRGYHLEEGKWMKKE